MPNVQLTGMDVQGWFQKYLQENNLEEQKKQCKILREPIPIVGRELVFHFAPHFHGEQNLPYLIENGFANDEQNRKVFSLVQASGFGKTKSCVALSYRYWVIFLRTMKEREPFKTIIACITELHLKLDKKSKQDILEFHSHCDRLMSLVFLVGVAYFNYMFREKESEADSIRYRFAFCCSALMSNEFFVWCNWWLTNIGIPAARNQSQLDDLKNLIIDEARSKPQKLVILFDEVHQLINQCKDYFLCREDYFSKAFDYNYGDHSSGTDLFYLLRSKIVDFVSMTPPPFAVCMTSTDFRTNEVLDETGSPFKRGQLLQEILIEQWFSVDDIKKIIQHYFIIEDEKLSPEILECWEGRPYYTYEFLKDLYMTWSEQVPIDTWLQKSSSRTFGQLVNNSKQTIRMYLKRNFPDAERSLLGLVYFSFIMCNGQYGYLETGEIYELVSNGFGCIQRKDSQLMHNLPTDKIFEMALCDCYQEFMANRNQDPIYAELKKLFESSKILLPNESSSKINLLEMAFARNLMLDKNKMFKCGTWQQLQFVDEIEALLNEKNVIIFPSVQAGPDLWLRMDYEIISVHCKCKAKVMTFSELLDALKSLNPFLMFSNRNSKQNNKKKKETEKKLKWGQNWTKHLNGTYRRIVVNVLGFTEECHYKVKKYNEKYAFPIDLKSFQSFSKQGNELMTLILRALQVKPQAVPTNYSMDQLETHNSGKMKWTRPKGFVKTRFQECCRECGINSTGKVPDLLNNLQQFFNDHSYDYLTPWDPTS